MAMDLISIAEINGARAEELRQERVKHAALNAHDKAYISEQQRKHGERVAARAAVNR
jgi:hypothetical protein